MSTTRRSLCAGIALALLVGCNGSAQPTQNAAAAHGDDNAARLKAMPDGARNAVFIRAIRDAGFDCQHVASSSPVGQSGTAAWSAVCTDSGQWIIAIGANGNAQVTRGAPLPPGEDPAG